MISTRSLAHLLYLKLLAEDLMKHNPPRYEPPNDAPYFEHKKLVQQHIDDQEKLVEQYLNYMRELDDEPDDAPNT